MLIVQLESCGLLVDYCDVFISYLETDLSFWETLILTAPIHCRGSFGEQVMLNLQMSSDEKNKLIYILGGLRMSKFSANFHFWVNYSLNSANLWFKARWNKTDKCEKHCAQLNSQKAFQFTNCHHLPWIYCSNTNCTIVFWQKCGIFIPKLYYIINVDVLNVLKE